MQHDLKIARIYFEEILDGKKTFEIRYNDRNYKKDDVLILNEFLGFYTGRKIKVKVNYMFTDPANIFLKKGFVILGIVKQSQNFSELTGKAELLRKFYGVVGFNFNIEKHSWVMSEAEKILDKHASANMARWNLGEFKRTHNSLYKSIIESIEEALNSSNNQKSTCSNCGKNPADEQHICPYRQDIDGDEETLCNCCISCTNECCRDIQFIDMNNFCKKCKSNKDTIYFGIAPDECLDCFNESTIDPEKISFFGKIQIFIYKIIFGIY